MDQTTSKHVDAEQTVIHDEHVQFEELGSVFKHTGIHADGGNRDGGYVSGNNYSYS